MAVAARSQPLTIQERILLHLAAFTQAKDAYTVPKEVTQAGIAAALGIRVAHASREVRKLVDDHLVEERDAAVAGARRHQKAYFLAPVGVQAAQKMRQELGGALPAPETAAVVGATRPHATVSVVRDLPPLRYFFGRAGELDAARKILEARGVLVVIGIAGIGKSTFGAKLLDELKGTRSCVWYSIHEYDTPVSVLAPVARLLALQGHPKLEMLTKREPAVDLARAKEVLLADLQGLQVAAFYDDAQAAPPEALQALRVLREVASEHPKTLKLVLLARARPPIYDARDVTLKKTVGEVELRGLGLQDATALLQVADRPIDASTVYDVTGGHPLFIELLRDAGDPALNEGPDRREIDRFVQEQIFSKLDRGERDALRRIVFHRRPVDPRMILSPPATVESLLTLEGRSLVRRDARGRVLAHESIRDFVRRTLSEEEERTLVNAAYRSILGEVEEANRRDDPAEAIALLEDALALAPNDNEVAAILVRLGGFHLAVAQYNQAAARLEEALKIIAKAPASPLRGLAHFLLGAVHSEAGQAQVARRHLEEASKAWEQPLPTLEPERGRLYLEYAKWETRYGSAAAARDWVDKGLKLGQALSHDFIIADGEMLMSHLTAARKSNEHLERCIEIAKRNEFSPMLSLAHTTYSWHLVDLVGDNQSALRHGGEGLKIADTLGNRVLAGLARAALAKAHWRSGDLRAAMAEARLGMETAEKSFTERIVPMALLSTLETETGNAGKGETIARELLQAAEKYGTPTEVLAAKRALARSLDVQGRYEEAIPLLETCHRVYERMALSCDAANHIATLDRLIRMEVARGDMVRAREWFEAAKQRLPEVDSPVGGALQNMAFAHLRQLEAPALAASYYWHSADTWRKLAWRLLELKMLVDCVNAVQRAQSAGEVIPRAIPETAVLEARIKELMEDLDVPRPNPVQGTPLA
jgi:tetratricopeptide (TPR) repeat protein